MIQDRGKWECRRARKYIVFCAETKLGSDSPVPRNTISMLINHGADSVAKIRQPFLQDQKSGAPPRRGTDGGPGTKPVMDVPACTFFRMRVFARVCVRSGDSAPPDFRASAGRRSSCPPANDPGSRKGTRRTAARTRDTFPRGSVPPIFFFFFLFATGTPAGPSKDAGDPLDERFIAAFSGCSPPPPADCVRTNGRIFLLPAYWK